MPLKLVPPRSGKTPNWSIRGTYLGVSVDRSAGTPRKSVADQQLRKLEGRIERGEYPEKPKQPDGPTFLSAAVAYLKNGGSRRHIKPLMEHFGARPLGDIDQDAIDAAALMLYPNVTVGTRNRCAYTPISAVLHHAKVNIVVARPKGHKGKPKTRFLLPPDAFAIVDAASAVDPEMGRLLRFLLYTGCRIGEALALKWENVDLTQQVAYIETSKNDDPRTMKLRDDVCSMLEPFARTEGRVFRFKQGGHRNFIFLNAKVTACGLPPVKRPKRGEKQVVPDYRLSWVTFHTFCHTWATWMRRFGGADLQGLVGTGRWRDRRSAERYTHVAAGEEWDRVNLLPSSGKSVETEEKGGKEQ